VTRAILDGQSSPHADLAYLNAGAAIYAAGRADTIADGVAAAREACANGAGASTLEQFVSLSGELAPV
jgi:anthranilate phosphoribosyltransferase